MTENKLSPFDMDLCAMIEKVTSNNVFSNIDYDNINLTATVNTLKDDEKEALADAVKSRVGDRFVGYYITGVTMYFTIKIDPELKDYPNQYFYETKEFQKVPGSTYCRKLKEVEAVLFIKNNVDEVVAFTGGGTLTVPKTLIESFDDVAYYEFVTPNGVFITVFAGEYIVNDNGNFYKMNKKAFDSDFELKNE